MPYGRQLLQEEDFQQADIVHLQILHVDTISLLDLPEIPGPARLAGPVPNPAGNGPPSLFPMRPWAARV